ncbi:hypothetical protein AB5J62_28920 [Amycolatopsis sp. cg5]|uniref:hypothetical protein n=1 Tax=Amycolatopsis sp. cg5 TaxID=3238802 RepID=UPI0035265910
MAEWTETTANRLRGPLRTATSGPPARNCPAGSYRPWVQVDLGEAVPATDPTVSVITLGGGAGIRSTS